MQSIGLFFLLLNAKISASGKLVVLKLEGFTPVIWFGLEQNRPKSSPKMLCDVALPLWYRRQMRGDGSDGSKTRLPLKTKVLYVTKTVSKVCPCPAFWWARGSWLELYGCCWSYKQLLIMLPALVVCCYLYFKITLLLWYPLGSWRQLMAFTFVL